MGSDLEGLAAILMYALGMRGGRDTGEMTKSSVLTPQQVWASVTSTEIAGVANYVLPVGFYEFEIYCVVAGTFTYEVKMSGAWHPIWERTYAVGEYNSLSPFLSDGVNARIQSGAGLRIRLMRMGST